MKSPTFTDIEPMGNDNDVLTDVVKSTSLKSMSDLISQLASSTHMTARQCRKNVKFDLIVLKNSSVRILTCKGTTFFANKQMFIYFLLHLLVNILFLLHE